MLGRDNLLYAQNKDKSNKQRRLKYKANLNTQTFPTIPRLMFLFLNILKLHMETHLLQHSLLQLYLLFNFLHSLPLPPSTHPPSPYHHHILVNPGHSYAHQWFHERINDFSLVHICSICKESYPNMKNKFLHGNLYCSRHEIIKSTHRFSLANNMDPGNQPFVLTALKKIEEILISRVSLIFQVTHDGGGQYKYIGHTICFPQDITAIANILRCLVSELDIVVVTRYGCDHKKYDFIVIRTHVLLTLEYKLAHDPCYKDVQLDQAAISALPTHPTNIYCIIRRISLSSPKTLQPFYFISTLPNSLTELEEIHNYLQSPHHNSNTSLSWPSVSLFTINEYTT